MVLCNYNNTTTYANMVIEFSSVSGASATAGALKAAADGQASAHNTTATPVSGFGTAAYMVTENNASTNASGVATTNMEILDGSKLVDITAELTPTQAQAVARYVLAY